jgi:hypothetical protein
MKRSLMTLMLAAAGMMSSPAWALFNAQVLTGKRDAKFKASGSSSDTISGNELRAAAHLDPIPLVPVAFGLSLAQTTWDKSSDKLTADKIDGLDVNLEIEAWLPIELGGLVPYAKVNYTVAGAYTVESQEVLPGVAPKFAYKPSGAGIAVGLKWEFLLRLGVMLELEQATRKLKFDKVSNQGGLNIPDQPDIDQTSTSILVGVQAGI